jgi:hypothetical protein
MVVVKSDVYPSGGGSFAEAQNSDLLLSHFFTLGG